MNKEEISALGRIFSGKSQSYHEPGRPESDCFVTSSVTFVTLISDDNSGYHSSSLSLTLVREILTLVGFWRTYVKFKEKIKQGLRNQKLRKKQWDSEPGENAPRSNIGGVWRPGIQIGKVGRRRGNWGLACLVLWLSSVTYKWRRRKIKKSWDLVRNKSI